MDLSAASLGRWPRSWARKLDTRLTVEQFASIQENGRKLARAWRKLERGAEPPEVATGSWGRGDLLVASDTMDAAERRLADLNELAHFYIAPHMGSRAFSVRRANGLERSALMRSGDILATLVPDPQNGRVTAVEGDAPGQRRPVGYAIAIAVDGDGSGPTLRPVNYLIAVDENALRPGRMVEAVHAIAQVLAEMGGRDRGKRSISSDEVAATYAAAFALELHRTLPSAGVRPSVGMFPPPDLRGPAHPDLGL
jgi:hypothetical protein